MNTNKELIRNSERAHYIMQLCSYFNELSDFEGMRYAYTSLLSDIWYNQAYDIITTESKFDSLLQKIIETCKSKDRLPCIYLSPVSEPSNIRELLEKRNFGKFEDESWMFYNFSKFPTNGQKSSDISIKLVENDNDKEIFADIYRKGLPGPEVEKYIQATMIGLENKPPLVDIWYMNAFYKNKPAGMLSLLKIGEYAGVYAVATIEEFQNKGVAKALSEFAAEIAKQNEVKHLFLQTVSGEESEEIFKKLGYETLYVRDGYTTNDVISKLMHG
jgi:GNAT superfamily N-acetyltransferase